MKRILTAASIAVLLGTAPVFAHSNNGPDKPQRVEVTFVLDTTGSMSGLIGGAKRKIWSIANSIVDLDPRADIRMSLVGYRDFGEDYVVKTYPLTQDIQGLYGHLMEFRARGGGDMPEAVNEALAESLDKVGWSAGDDVKRLVFLVGDAPPHMDYNGPKYPELMKTAVKRGIKVNAVQAGASRQTRKVWQEIAHLGDGNYIPIPQDGGKVLVIETPYDNDIIILQRQLDETVLPYGNKKIRSGLISKIKRRIAAPKSVSVENSKFYSKRGKGAEIVTGKGDLIADYEKAPEKIRKLKKEELPKVLQGKSFDEQKAYIAELTEKRRKLQSEMNVMVTKRDEYVRREQAKTKSSAGDSFDRAVGRTIRQSLKK